MCRDLLSVSVYQRISESITHWSIDTGWVSGQGVPFRTCRGRRAKVRGSAKGEKILVLSEKCYTHVYGRLNVNTVYFDEECLAWNKMEVVIT